MALPQKHVQRQLPIKIRLFLASLPLATVRGRNRSFPYLRASFRENPAIDMGNIVASPLRFLVALLAAGFLALAVSAQTDRPCGAPLLPLTDCSLTTPLLLAGSAFQAADAPIPGGCNAGYTHDVWLRVVAPSNEVTISFVLRNFGFAGTPTSPSQINALFYTATPDCNNLVNPIGCATNCPLALVCITLDGMEGHANSRRYPGLTAGNTYYLRVLWNPVSAPAPDTVRLSFANTTCGICDPCGGVDFVLGQAEQHFAAQWESNHVSLSCESNPGGLQPTFLRSADAKVWQELAATPTRDGDLWVAQDHETQQGQRLYYRARFTDVDGLQSQTDIAEVMAGAKPWLRSATWLPEALQLEVALDADATLRIYDLQGSLLSEIPVSKQDRHISIPIPTPGNEVLILNLAGSIQAKTQLIYNRHR
jgi:hypothetical protein